MKTSFVQKGLSSKRTFITYRERNIKVIKENVYINIHTRNISQKVSKKKFIGDANTQGMAQRTSDEEQWCKYFSKTNWGIDVFNDRKVLIIETLISSEFDVLS